MKIKISIYADVNTEPNDNIEKLKQEIIDETFNIVSKIKGNDYIKSHNICSYIENVEHNVTFLEE